LSNSEERLFDELLQIKTDHQNSMRRYLPPSTPETLDQILDIIQKSRARLHVAKNAIVKNFAARTNADN